MESTNPETHEQQEVQDQERENEDIINFQIKLPDGKSLKVQASTLETVAEIKTYLTETKEACTLTCYHLQIGDRTLIETDVIGEIEEMKEDAIVTLVEDPYDEYSSRQHVRYVQQLLRFYSENYPFNDSSPPTVINDLSTEQYEFEGLRVDPDNKNRDIPLLNQFFPKFKKQNSGEPKSQKYLQSLNYSGWNPAPKNRRLQGDFFYLDVITIENENLTITACPDGFYVNQSKPGKFNPAPSSKSHQSTTLIGCLSSASSIFKKRFAELLERRHEQRPFETLDVPNAITPWIAYPRNHTYDIGRAEQDLMANVEIEYHTIGQTHDWNEGIQVAREMPKETVADRITRDKTLFRNHTEFIEYATQGAVAIINGNVPPMNPTDEKSSHMYIYNNIFFSHTSDSRDSFKNAVLGPKETALKAAYNDLNGVRMINELEIDGIHTVETAIIQYRGYHLVAQSILPGLFSGLIQGEKSIAYGSLEGKIICSDKDFHESLGKAAPLLHLKEHKVKDSEGTVHTLWTSSNIKGVVGADGRKYFLDFVNLTPRDANYKGEEYPMAVLRKELITAYISHLIQQEQIKRIQKKKEEQEKKEAQEKKDGVEKKDDVEKKDESEDNKNEEPKEEEEEPIPIPDLRFNTDIFRDVELADDEEEIKKDTELIEELSNFLINHAIPNMVNDFRRGISVPIDGATLTSVMHTRGINMRYLGRVTTECQKVFPSIADICIREMICRAARYIFNDYISVQKESDLASATAHFLKQFFNRSSFSSKGSKSGIDPEKIEADESKGELTHHLIWFKIRELVKKKYQYTLPENIPASMFEIATLRSLCMKCGIRLEAKSYDLDKSDPISPSNVYELFPVVKHYHPKTNDGTELMTMGKQFMAKGRLDSAYDLLQDALSIFLQVYGPMQRDTGHCYANLAMILYHTQDLEQAYRYQREAVIINERALGLDHYDTCHAYGNLALICHGLGKTKLALNYIKRSLYLGHLAGGWGHPDNATTYINVATMLQDLKDFKLSLNYLYKALALNEKLFGEDHLVTAATCHQIAVTLSFLEDYKEALNYEKRNYQILKNNVEPTDLRLVESNIWLQKFTQKAVAIEKEKNSKEPQVITKSRSNLKSRKGLLNNKNTKTDSTISDPNIANMSVADIMQFINTPSQPKRKSKKK